MKINPKYEEAMASKESKLWKKVMKREIDALEENNIWTVMKRLNNCESINSKWIQEKTRRKRRYCRI